MAQDRKAMSIKHLNQTYENGGKVVDYATVNVGSSKLQLLHSFHRRFTINCIKPNC